MIVYGKPSKEYHATPSLTSGGLRDFIRSPALYADRRAGLIPSKTSPAMHFGTVFHLAVLEPEKYAASVVVRPDDLTYTTKEGKAWREGNKDREILTVKDHERLTLMLQRMPPDAGRMLSSGRSEVTIRNKIGGFDAQCRADHWDRPGRMLYDLKTIGAIEKIEREIYDRGYHIQGRFYQRIIEAETGILPTLRLIFAESAPPYRWRIVQLDVDFQMMADTAIDNALAEMAACEKSGKWEDREDLHLVVSPPSWLNDDETTDEDEE